MNAFDKLTTTLLLIALSAVSYQNTANASTLEDVQNRGFIRCGVNVSLPGFSSPDANGIYTGLDVDYCRGLAAAVFNDGSAVEYVPLSSSQRFEALTRGEIDVLARNTTWTMSRDTAFGDFVGVSYYDGQGFMVRRSMGINSATELSGARVCVLSGTTTELNATDYFKSNRLTVQFVTFEDGGELVKAYDQQRCDVYTTDRSGLAAQKQKLQKPSAHKILPEIISKEPLGPVVRQGDSQWADIARWTLNCWINAEEMGIERKNVNRQIKSRVPSIRRLLGRDGDFGKNLGLRNSWCYNLVALVGNYGESYNRNVGPDTPLKLQRGVNALWTNGGILYAPPIR
ncbi:MAG: amino acid ABC transporter substrate-binding protein [Granulosicoccus sp.]|nr:amino acid ABC transporter substrate-binding protein [Granulosicoccus sp.]